MRRGTVKLGLDLLIVAIAMVTMATFFHGQLAQLFSLPVTLEDRLVFFGLFGGGICGCLGILVTILGLLRTPSGSRMPLAPSLIILAATIFLFFFLLYASFSTPEPNRLRPGESITI